jgi:exodeoxyribonuclease VII small subunit
MSKKATPNFEKSLQELETLVERLERGDLSLEESLKQYERGIALTRLCQQALSEAEQKVEILSNGQVVPFPTAPETGEPHAAE